MAMTKGQEQAKEAAAICREASAKLKASPGEGEGSPLAARLDEQAAKLDASQYRLFAKMAAAVRFTEPCLAAAREVQAGLAAEPVASDLETRVQALEAAVTALHTKSMSPGTIVIT